MSSMVLDGATPLSRSTDPVTSVDAGRSVNVIHSRDYVLQTLRVFGPFADHELVEFHDDDRTGQKHFGRFSAQRLRSARADLVRDGLVEQIEGEFRQTDSGRRAHVWRAVAQPATYAEKVELMRLKGLILITEFGVIFGTVILDHLAGSSIERDELGNLKMTDAQRDQVRAEVDKIAAEIGSRDLVDIAYHLFGKE